MKRYKIKNFNSLYSALATFEYLKAIKNGDIDKLLKYIYECEFDIEINKNGTLDLIDLQGVYLGGFETYENFETLEDVCKRLEGSRLFDYFNIDIY